MGDWEELLDFLEANKHILDISEIERELGLSKTTLHRIISKRMKTPKHERKILAFFSALAVKLNNVYE